MVNVKDHFEISQHAQLRMRQRTVTMKDLSLICTYGEAVDEGYVMTNKAIEDSKHALQGDQLLRVERLRGMAAIVKDGVLVTTYRSSRRRLRRLRGFANPVRRSRAYRHWRH